MRKKILLAIIITARFFTGHAQTDWKLKTDDEGIKVYTKSLPGSKIKAIKIECTVQATMSQLVYVIMDINTSKEWVYNTKSCVMLKQVSPLDLYYYSEVNVPWPVSNRDFVAHLTVAQNPSTKAVTVVAENLPNLVPKKNNVVRIQQSDSKWVATPVGTNLVKIEYTLFADPGGIVPAWLLNLFITRGPFESFKKLREQVKKPAYINIHLANIKD